MCYSTPIEIPLQYLVLIYLSLPLFFVFSSLSCCQPGGCSYLGTAEHDWRGKYFHPVAVATAPNTLAKGDSGDALQRRLWKLCETLAARG